MNIISFYSYRSSCPEGSSSRGSHNGITRRPNGLSSDHPHHGFSGSTIPTTAYQMTDREGERRDVEEEGEEDVAGAGLSPTQRRELSRLGLI